MRHCALGLLPAVALWYAVAGCSAVTDTDPGKLGRDAAASDDAGSGDGASGDDGGTTQCPGTQIRCGGGCVDPSSDPRHCGGCNRSCRAGTRCISGVCACAEPFGRCSGSCVDLRSSRLDCGECGRACDRDRLCVQGDCRDFVHAEGCERCPCPDACADFDRCCPTDEGPLCVDADSCP